MIVSLAIVVVLAGMFALRFETSIGEERLRPVADEIRKMARRAIGRAAAYREDYVIGVFPGEIVLMRGGVGEQRREEAKEAVVLPKGIRVEVRRAGEEDWTAVRELAWIFRAGGLCEPLSLRFSVPDADEGAYVQLQFDPLTAQAKEESYFP